jgi:mannose-6-phosphate isomerase-like protein (cupin superfamily)
MLITKFPNFKSAEFGSTKPDKKYQYERHQLKAGEIISWHYHKRADEIIIIDWGLFAVLVGEEYEVITLRSGYDVLAIYLPKKKPHSFIALSDVSYAVYKTKPDMVIRCKGPAVSLDLKNKMEGGITAWKLLEGSLSSKSPLEPKVGVIFSE